MKKHIRSNIKNLIINFFALFLSLFAILTTINVISFKNELNTSILDTFPNNNVFRISKNVAFDDGGSYSIVQKARPTINEIKSLSILKNGIVDIDLSYLLNNYTFKVDDLIQNEHILFEPHFLNDEMLYYSNLEYESFNVFFEQEFRIEKDGETVFETFKMNFNNLELQKIKTFNFLSSATIYYPYNYVKNAAEHTYFASIETNLYDFLYEKNSRDIETNYSLVGVYDDQTYNSFLNSEFTKVYELANNPHEITNNFMTLFSTIIDFCFYFLIVIVVLVFILFLYTIYLNILKNHKEIALLKTFGMSKHKINAIYRFEILCLVIVSFVFALLLTYVVFLLTNTYVLPALNISFSLKFNWSLTALLFGAVILAINFLMVFPLVRINKINIRKELNSL
jgi:ABC-type antimicrobial peptide transport system permease subunit